MFSDHYDEQNSITLNQEKQAFSFLHRSFLFQKNDDEPIESVQIEMAPPEVSIEDQKKEEEKKAPEAEKKEDKPEEKKAPRKRVLKKAPAEPTEEPVLFFGADEGKGDWRMFSNMFDAKTQIDSVTFPTVEHYFQWSKAKLFGDGAIAEKILKTPSPKAVKALGKKVKDFNKDEWDTKKDEIMRKGVKAKIAQHPDIKTKLLETGTRPIGEANARDKYWGIGTSTDTAKAKDPAKWPGKNVLGKILMELRTEFKE
jgi:ribA/ribD-fused uncharacterized protein